ncbi:MAG: hypothetical protein ABJH45_14725, partial [Paracoccaceae bacterium]
LLDGDVVAIDGSRFKAVNSKAKNYTRGKLRQKLGEIDKAIERYLGELYRADEVFEQTRTVLPEARMERILVNQPRPRQTSMPLWKDQTWQRN